MTICGVEQLEARKAHNLEVAGSSPAPATESASARVAAQAEYAGEPATCNTSPPLTPASVSPSLAGFFLPFDAVPGNGVDGLLARVARA